MNLARECYEALVRVNAGIDARCDAAIARQLSMTQIRRSVAQRWRADRKPKGARK